MIVYRTGENKSCNGVKNSVKLIVAIDEDDIGAPIDQHFLKYICLNNSAH